MKLVDEISGECEAAIAPGICTGLDEKELNECWYVNKMTIFQEGLQAVIWIFGL